MMSFQKAPFDVYDALLPVKERRPKGRLALYVCVEAGPDNRIFHNDVLSGFGPPSKAGVSSGVTAGINMVTVAPFPGVLMHERP